ncbi:glycosyltransferase [Nocardioides sambongensis]|uniref:glycosyltransferase n=1 Tax=Nocardioides sambongensis TaxID=2589074 RepID=UPI001126FC1C|nr:glycosyltransferase [Nocardioides sambongensis]
MADGLSGRPLVVWQAGVTWDDVVGTDRQLVKKLTSTVDILWIDPPRSAAHVRPLRPSAAHSFVTEVDHGIRRLIVTTTPFPRRRGVSGLTTRLLRRAIRQAVRRDGRQPLATVGTNPYFDADAVPGVRAVYYATDDFVAGARLMGTSVRQIGRCERRAVRGSDEVGAITHAVAERWEGATRPRFVLPNGCDVDHYADLESGDRAADVALSRPVAGVVGQLSSRIDLSLLEAVVDSGISILLVGPISPGWETARVAALIDRPQVQWVGSRPYGSLPSYLRAMDVGLTPYRNTAFNRASFPLKTLEYLAAGLPVVSTPLPAVTALDTSLIHTAKGPAEFAAEVASALATSTAAAAVEGRKFARRHSWQRRADALLSVLNGADPEDWTGVEVVGG